MTLRRFAVHSKLIKDLSAPAEADQNKLGSLEKMRSATRVAFLAAGAILCAATAQATTIIRQIDFSFPVIGAPSSYVEFFGSFTVEMVEGLTTPGTGRISGPTPDFHLLQADLNLMPNGGGPAIVLASSPADVPALTYRAIDGRLVNLMMQRDTRVGSALGPAGDWSLTFYSSSSDPSQDVLTGEFSFGYNQFGGYCEGAYAVYFERYAYGREYCVVRDNGSLAVSEAEPSVSAVPVPAALPMLGLGLLGLAALRRRV